MPPKWFLTTLLPVLFSPLYADAQSTKPLIFDSIPISDIDESASFKTCGYQFRGQIDQENWDTMLQVLIYKNKNNDYFVSTGLAEKSTIKSNWNPKNSVVQWVRVGAADPIKLDPYNLITIPDKGASAFSTPKSNTYNIFNEIEKKGSTIWVRIFDKEDNEYRVYSGTIKIDKNAINMTAQCIENLHSTK
jgi:hypothetical protein